MGLTLSSFALCSNCLGIGLPDQVYKGDNDKHPPKRNFLREIINDINNLVATDTKTHTNQVLDHILHRLMKETESDIGFIGRVDGNVLKTISVSNSAWDFSSHEFYKQHFGKEVRHPVSLFLPNRNEAYYINNKCWNDKSFKKQPLGHPLIKRFACIPSLPKPNGKNVVILLANRQTKYPDELIDMVSPVADLLSYLFIRLEN